MIIGTVRWFNPELGFGFIVVNEFEDALVHYTAIRMKGFRTLSDGDIVMYDLPQKTKTTAFFSQKIFKHFL